MTRRRRKPAILIADDDVYIRRLVARHLEERGFDVALASNGEEAIYQASLTEPEVIILDLTMPVMDGFQTLERLRDWYLSPVIVLSATDEEREKVRALDLGADDYITKPFSVEELAARVRASLRRAERFAQAPEEPRPLVRAGDIEIDLAARIVKRASQEIRLTRTEYDVLRTMAVSAGKILTHRQILHAVWGPEYTEETEYLRTFIKQLRRKLENEPSRPRHILTEPGIGYRLFVEQPARP